MFRNYLTVAWRNLVRHRLYSAINIVGLAIGLTCVVFVALVVRDQLSYDKWIPGTQNLYQVEMTLHLPGRPAVPLAVTPFPLAAAMRDRVPGVTGMTRISTQLVTLANGDHRFPQYVDEVDPDFFTMIRLPLVAGRRSSVFRDPDSVVLSEAAAQRYFGNTNPIGRALTLSIAGCTTFHPRCWRGPVALKVTGIVKDLPHDTQLAGDVFIPNTAGGGGLETFKDDWSLANPTWGYVRLAPGVDPARVVSSMAPLLDRRLAPVARQMGIPVRASRAYRVHLTRFTRVHLTSGRWQANLTPAGSWTTILGVVVVGALILLAACLNFMNLATALASVRGREIALRKILGAHRGQLVAQFLGEAVLTALLSLALALAAAEILLPLFVRILGHAVRLHYADAWGMLLVLFGIAVLTGLLSGSYPALALSAIRPAKILGSGGSYGPRRTEMRNLLVFIQFAISIGLGIVVGVVFNQISYARHVDLGFDHNDVVVIANGVLNGKQREAFADALRANPGVESVGSSNLEPFEPGQITSLITTPGRSVVTTFNTLVIGPNYPVAYGIRLLDGRLLSISRGDDRLSSIGRATDGDPGNEGRNVLINATGARKLGFSPQDAVGKIIEYNHNDVHIVGVLADTKLDGARQRVVPTVYIYVPNSPMDFSVRLRPGSIPQTMSFIDRTWRAFVPGVAITRYFLDAPFEALYQGDDRQGTLFGVFVVVAVMIGCLGLYGLAAFSAERRVKEIGIRKMSGAHAGDIARLTLWRISVPVLAANLIAWPVAYLYLRHWLDGFAYRIPLGPLYFLGAGAAALLIAWATVFAHTLRLAHTHPVKALRYE